MWEPDWAVTTAVADGRLSIRDLSTLDTCWVVADLTRRGYTAVVIASWLRCTPRHVKRLRARVETQLMMRWDEQRERAERAEQTVRHLINTRPR